MFVIVLEYYISYVYVIMRHHQKKSNAVNGIGIFFFFHISKLGTLIFASYGLFCESLWARPIILMN